MRFLFELQYLIQMGGKGTVFILLMSVLLSFGHGLDWLGAGNWTLDNLTIIWAKINSFDTVNVQTRHALVSSFSDDLNNIWHPAWNVVLCISMSDNFDAVLYGYGFNGHWFWANGFKNSALMYYSFIIWKDYNCITWQTFDAGDKQASISTYSQSVKTNIDSRLQNNYDSRNLNDIWKVAQNIQATFPSADNLLFLDNYAYSVIASPIDSVGYFFKVCAKNYAIVTGVGAKSVGESGGSALIMQMRDS